MVDYKGGCIHADFFREAGSQPCQVGQALTHKYWNHVRGEEAVELSVVGVGSWVRWEQVLEESRKSSVSCA